MPVAENDLVALIGMWRERAGTVSDWDGNESWAIEKCADELQGLLDATRRVAG